VEKRPGKDFEEFTGLHVLAFFLECASCVEVKCKQLLQKKDLS